MLTMSKEKRPGRGRPPKHAGDPDQMGRTGTPVSLRLDPELVGKLPEFIVSYRRKTDVKLSKTDVVELALTRLFRDYGILPPAESDKKK